jgi:hypothetical protein
MMNKAQAYKYRVVSYTRHCVGVDGKPIEGWSYFDTDHECDEYINEFNVELNPEERYTLVVQQYNGDNTYREIKRIDVPFVNIASVWDADKVNEAATGNIVTSHSSGEPYVWYNTADLWDPINCPVILQSQFKWRVRSQILPINDAAVYTNFDFKDDCEYYVKLCLEGKKDEEHLGENVEYTIQYTQAENPTVDDWAQYSAEIREATGKKNDRQDDKQRWDLLPLEELADIVHLYTAGAKKYGDNNWQHLKDGYNRYKGAMLRHLYAYERGEEFDEETGGRHLAAVAWNAIAMLYLSKHNYDTKRKS